jgi:hypothetical protein
VREVEINIIRHEDTENNDVRAEGNKLILEELNFPHSAQTTP